MKHLIKVYDMFIVNFFFHIDIYIKIVLSNIYKKRKKRKFNSRVLLRNQLKELSLNFHFFQIYF